jgi:hypothetical protein
MVSSRQYRLRIGRVVIALNCHDQDYAGSIERYFDLPSDPGTAAVTLDLNIVPHDDRPVVPNSLIQTKNLRDDGFDIADGLIGGRYDPESGTGTLHVKNILTSGLMTRVFEQILYQAWHSGRSRLRYDACLLHSAGVICEGRGFLFVGPSEAGKSTIALLSGERTVLNDEMCLVEFHTDGPRLVSTPFNGHFRAKKTGAAPLEAVFLLEHGPRHELKPVGLGEAAGAIAGQVAPPVGLDEVAGSSTRLAMLDLASRLVHAVPVRRLSFLPDDGFWPLILEAFIQDSRG